MQPHCRIARYDCCLVDCVGLKKFVVICTKVKYQWHFIKHIRKALLLLPVNVVCIIMSLIKTVSILMLHAKNTGQPWMSWAYEQRIHGQLVSFPGEYMNKWKLDFTLPLGWLYSLCCLIYCHSLYTYAVTGCSYCANTHTVYPCEDSRSHAIPACDSKLILWQKNVTLFRDFHFNSKYWSMHVTEHIRMFSNGKNRHEIHVFGSAPGKHVNAT
jgi:hypothetical protein